MKDLTLLKSLTEDEYNQLLRQAVAVIEASRIQIAKQQYLLPKTKLQELIAEEIQKTEKE